MTLVRGYEASTVLSRGRVRAGASSGTKGGAF